MAVVASLTRAKLFCCLPSPAPPSDPTLSTSTPPPPIPIPKYPPPRKSYKAIYFHYINHISAKNGIFISLVNDNRHAFEGGVGDDQFKRYSNNTVSTSPKMLSLWKRAFESNKGLLLDEINLGPDALLMKVVEFEGVSQATEHSYMALILLSEAGAKGLITDSEDGSEDDRYSNDDCTDDDDNIYSEDEFYEDDFVMQWTHQPQSDHYPLI